jgi:hypothetical protein
VQQETATPKTNKQIFMDTRPRRFKKGNNRISYKKPLNDFDCKTKPEYIRQIWFGG